MDQFPSFDIIKQRVVASNSNAAKNRNLYPIQEQATSREIWETVPCECGTDCTCRQFGCTHHWKMKTGLNFLDVLPAFVRMFVDKMYHKRLMDWLSTDNQLPSSVPTRIEGALVVLDNLRRNWDTVGAKAANHRTSLLCDEWFDDLWQREWLFDVRRASVYQAKQFCVLLPDVGVPFDNASRTQLLNFFHGDILSYFDLLHKLRSAVVSVLNAEHQSLSDFRRLDSPEEQIPFDSRLISMSKASINYGTGYIPRERPLSRVIDKYFYRPSKESNEFYQARQPQIRPGLQTLIPLSGEGKPINCQIYDGGRQVAWGTTRFDLPDKIIEDILDNFFTDSDKWYWLGASMTNPTSGGLGEFISSKFTGLGSRHASPIAAIMVQDNLIEFRGKRPIELRKLPPEL
jgi:hypothetical protein